MGTAAIVAAALLLREGQDFPGWRATIPVGGAAALIAAGPNGWGQPYRFCSGRGWSGGCISYPLYLWHWVLLSYSTVLVGGPPVWASRLCLLTLSFVASWMTYFFVERWFRNGSAANVKAVGLCAAMLVVIAVAFITWKRDGLDSSSWLQPVRRCRHGEPGARAGIGRLATLIPLKGAPRSILLLKRSARTSARAPLGR